MRNGEYKPPIFSLPDLNALHFAAVDPMLILGKARAIKRCYGALHNRRQRRRHAPCVTAWVRAATYPEYI